MKSITRGNLKSRPNVCEPTDLRCTRRINQDDVRHIDNPTRARFKRPVPRDPVRSSQSPPPPVARGLLQVQAHDAGILGKIAAVLEPTPIPVETQENPYGLLQRPRQVCHGGIHSNHKIQVFADRRGIREIARLGHRVQGTQIRRDLGKLRLRSRPFFAGSQTGCRRVLATRLVQRPPLFIPAEFLKSRPRLWRAGRYSGFSSSSTPRSQCVYARCEFASTLRRSSDQAALSLPRSK